MTHDEFVDRAQRVRDRSNGDASSGTPVLEGIGMPFNYRHLRAIDGKRPAPGTNDPWYQEIKFAQRFVRVRNGPIGRYAGFSGGTLIRAGSVFYPITPGALQPPFHPQTVHVEVLARLNRLGTG